MDYERIQKNSSCSTLQGNVGALSPRKLRSMLLGVEDKIKKNKHQDQEIAYSLKSQASEIDDSGGCFSEDCKDVDVVSINPECTNSTTTNSYTAKTNLKPQDNYYLNKDNDIEYMSVPSPIFEFPKRGPLGSLSKHAPSKWDDAQKWIASPTSNRSKGAPTQGHFGYKKTNKPVTKVVVEVPFEEPDTKRVDYSQNKSENICLAEAYPIPESKEILALDNCVAETAIINNETTFITPLSTARSVSMRDMGTEMTPIVSQEPSRTGTPVRATTPSQSPTNSRSSTPKKNLDLNKNVLSEKEMQMKTRREIMALGTQLGKTNIAAWASKEEEIENNESNILENVVTEQTDIEARAAAWEEAEKAKYMARFKREEMKIQAWENHEKAIAEAEMRKIEVKVERKLRRANDRLTNKISETKNKAEKKRAAAEAKREKQDAKTECIITSRFVPSFCCCGWCI